MPIALTTFDGIENSAKRPSLTAVEMDMGGINAKHVTWKAIPITAGQGQQQAECDAEHQIRFPHAAWQAPNKQWAPELISSELKSTVHYQQGPLNSGCILVTSLAILPTATNYQSPHSFAGRCLPSPSQPIPPPVLP